MSLYDSPLQKYKTLIADDAAATRRGTRLMLALNPKIEVVAIAHDGIQAVEAVRNNHIDISLVDINMPELDGITAISKMLQIRPELVCIVMSAERSSGMLQKAMAAGARGYLIKPYTTEELDEAIERAEQIISESRKKAAAEDQVRKQRDSYALKLAYEYAKVRRTDDQAVQVFEYLANRPGCDLKWLKHLAMVYVLRSDWGKLGDLAASMNARRS